jgi:hypothetical protein
MSTGATTVYVHRGHGIPAPGMILPKSIPKAETGRGELLRRKASSAQSAGSDYLVDTDQPGKHSASDTGV